MFGRKPTTGSNLGTFISIHSLKSRQKNRIQLDAVSVVYEHQLPALSHLKKAVFCATSENTGGRSCGDFFICFPTWSKTMNDAVAAQCSRHHAPFQDRSFGYTLPSNNKLISFQMKNNKRQT